jgi:hypothetical protein
MRTFLLFITLSLLISCGKDDSSSDVTPISKYTLSVTATDGGTVSSPGGSYNEGSSVTITASPNSEYIFENWSNGSTENPLTITVNQNISLTANFVKRKYPLTINIQGEGTVREEIVSSAKSSDPTEYNSGTTVRLTAVPSGEWNVFDSWTGDINDENSIIEFIIDEPKEITVNFEESSLILKSNVTTIDNSSISSQDVMRSFYTVSGVFPYVSDGVQYMFYPGSSDWVAGFSDNLTKNDIPPMPSQILRKIDGGWEFFKTDLNAYFWGARNFEIIDNYIAIGDGNEIGPDGPSWSGEEQTDNNWNGDLYFGEIVGGGNINWTKVNSIEDRIYSHGTTIGDINGDGLLDVGSAPNAGQNTLKIYTQELDGTFTNNDDLLQLVDNRQPFTLDFSDLDNDGIDEIITANYGGGDPSQDPLLNNIRVYKYSSSSEQFEINFMSNNSTAFYDIGLGATSILTEDFDGDGIKDIVVAREDIDGNSFEIWKGISDGSYVPHFSSPVWTENELQFREFRIFDVNNDGFLDIILRPFHYGNLYRNNSDCWWNVKQCNGIKLNTIIQINNGDGTFSSYDREELIIDSIDVDNVHPYMENGILHFIGTYPYNVDDQYFDYQLSTYDIKVRILN